MPVYHGLPPPEQFLDIGVGQFHPGRAAVVTLARARCDFHFTQQRIHLRDRQDPPGADRAVAGDGRRDMIESVAQAQRPPSSAISAARSGSRPGHRSYPAPGPRARSWRCHQTARAQAPLTPIRHGRFEAVALHLLKFDNFGHKRAWLAVPAFRAARIRSSTSRSCAACWSTMTSPSSASATI